MTATPWRRRDLPLCGDLTRLPTLGQCPQKVAKISEEDLGGACENKDLKEGTKSAGELQYPTSEKSFGAKYGRISDRHRKEMYE